MTAARTWFDDLALGDVQRSRPLIVDRAAMLDYASRYDPWDFHVDEDAAAQSHFGGLIASGGYTISLSYILGHETMAKDGKPWAFLGGFDWQLKFQKPVRAGDELHLTDTILDLTPSRKGGRGIVKFRREMWNQAGDVVLSIDIVGLVAAKA
ncbi:MAG: MaoC/PaaZ C-terminal domain-containing protein [Niveispirillum sp.]|uniref:MaoC/PaaZ C-terminal domain-containing protein n=1 Tax=Niveispirillum sp. TaxID=1917217 RepID=UPI003BA5B393